MSTIVDVYMHGSVHLTNPGLEELLADTLSQGTSRSLLGPRGPADFLGGVGGLPYQFGTFQEIVARFQFVVRKMFLHNSPLI